MKFEGYLDLSYLENVQNRANEVLKKTSYFLEIVFNYENETIYINCQHISNAEKRYQRSLKTTEGEVHAIVVDKVVELLQEIIEKEVFRKW